MTQGGEEGKRDLKILCCYYRMRSTSTGVGNETCTEAVGGKSEQEFGGPNYEIDQHFPDGKAD